MFVSITALVTFAVSHLRLTVYCVSLKCVIAVSQVVVAAESVVSHRRGEMGDFLRMSLLSKSEMLIVDDCAAVEEQKTHQLAEEEGMGGKASRQN